MSQRIAALLALAGFILTVMGVWLWGGNLGPEPGSSRVSFQIATGSTGTPIEPFHIRPFAGSGGERHRTA